MDKLKWVTKSVSFSYQDHTKFTQSVSFPSAFRVTHFCSPVSGPLTRWSSYRLGDRPASCSFAGRHGWSQCRRAAKTCLPCAGGHANLLCIVPSLTDDPRRESELPRLVFNSFPKRCGNPSNGTKAWTTQSPRAPYQKCTSQGT